MNELQVTWAMENVHREAFKPLASLAIKKLESFLDFSDEDQTRFKAAARKNGRFQTDYLAAYYQIIGLILAIADYGPEDPTGACIILETLLPE